MAHDKTRSSWSASRLCLVLLAAAYSCRDTAAYIVGGALMHHGALALDPRNFNGSENATDAAMALHYAALNAGHFIQSLEPDLILLVTPHGLALPSPFLFYYNPTAEGSVSVDAWLPCSFQPCTYNASVRLDMHLTRQLASQLSRNDLVTTLTGFGPPGQGTLPLQLGWAEVIPLYFLQRAFSEPPAEAAASVAEVAEAAPSGPAKSRRRAASESRRLAAQPQLHSGISSNDDDAAGGRHSHDFIVSKGGGDGAAAKADAYPGPGPNPGHGGDERRTDGAIPPIVVLSMPSRRYDRSVHMIPELIALGRDLFALLDALDQRIAVIVSGDLAHTWDPAGPYGFSDQAAIFDSAVLQWVRDLDRAALIKTAAKSVGDAKSCGYPGMVLLQGIMDGVNPENVHSVLLEYGHPSYYGMMCAVFDFQGDA